jgi:N6-adenosine-specific RNA methylase IME4
MSEYDLIYADPPWLWAARSPKGEGRSAKRHYSVMTLEDIKRLPIPSIAAPRSVLALWAIDPMLPEAFELARAWGFNYATVGLYWIKTNKKSPVSFNGNRVSYYDPKEIEKRSVFFTGTGYYTRANPETCLLFTRAKNKALGISGGGLRRFDRGVPRLLVAPVGRHSQKPEEARIRIERLFGEVRRVELFARSRRPGWDVFGNQVEGSISLEEEE